MSNELDNISQLPVHVIDQILSRLPIKEAVRTSILSIKWRYQWTNVPQLVFDDQCTSGGWVPSLKPPQERLVKIIDKVLLLHTGPIQKFKLSHEEFGATTDTDHWILRLSRVPIKEIVLDMWKGQYYKIPTSLFNCQDLIHLELYRCLVKIPSTFEGFKNLESLDLQHVEMSPDELEALISRCPVLKRLALRNLEGIKRFNVRARNLKELSLEGGYQDVTLGVMNHLKSVTLSFSYDKESQPGNPNSCNMHRFFQNLPKIQSLKLDNYSVKHLTVGNVRHTPPIELVHLNYLFTCIDFNNTDEMLTVLRLIISSPKLKHVDFQSRADVQQTTWVRTTAGDSQQDYQSFCLEQIQVVSMAGISGSKPEQEMMEFLLARSPKLRMMTIKPHFMCEEGKLFRELLRFRRASAQAEVIFLDPDDPEVDPS